MSDVASPCVRNCCLDDEDVCLGCLRSVDEIMRWGSADNTMRRQILKHAEERGVLRRLKLASRNDGNKN